MPRKSPEKFVVKSVLIDKSSRKEHGDCVIFAKKPNKIKSVEKTAHRWVSHYKKLAKENERQRAKQVWYHTYIADGEWCGYFINDALVAEIRKQLSV